MGSEVHSIANTVSPAADEFENAAAKLAALLQLPADAGVLLVGTQSHPWMKDLASSFSGCVERPEPVAGLGTDDGSRETFDLVLWSLGTDVTRHDLENGLRELRPKLREGGTLLLLAENRLALRRLRRQPGRLLNGRLRTLGGYRSQLKRAGFTRVDCFLPFPNASIVEELVGEESGIALPSYASLVEKGLNALGAYPNFHDAFLYVASNGESGTDRLISRLAPTQTADSASTRLHLERFALRPRGALILFLRDRATGQRSICRITTSPTVDRVVGENARWTRIIHESPRIPLGVKKLVPLPISVESFGDHKAYVEEQVPGVIAWKLAGNRRTEAALFKQTCAFLKDLSAGTEEDRLLGRRELEELLASSSQPWWDPGFERLFDELRSALISCFDGQRRAFSLSHGDFGYGNVLALPRSGKITGVIDWDQARVDLQGVDLVNFLLQRHRTTHRVPLLEAVNGLGEAVLRGESATSDPSIDFDGHALPDASSRAELLAWSILRFVERDARYRSGFLRNRDQLAEALRWASDKVRL